MKRRWLPILAALALVLCLVPMAAAAGLSGDVREVNHTHTPNDDGTCTGCGFQYTAWLRTDGGTSFESSIVDAFDKAVDWAGGDIRLLADAVLPDGGYLEVPVDAVYNLDCGAFTLSGSDDAVICISGTLNFTGGTLKNTRAGGCGVIVINTYEDNSSLNMVMSGGTIEVQPGPDGEGQYGYAISAFADSRIRVRGGNVGTGARALLADSSDADVLLSGGTYGDITASADETVDKTVPSLLENGCAFFKGDQPVALTETQKTLSGPVTVGTCTHIYEYVRTEGAETHSKVCLACGDGKDAEPEPCSFQNGVDLGDGTHRGVCACGRKKTEGHGWTYRSRSVDGKPLSKSIYQLCRDCPREEVLGTITRTADLSVPYGQTKDCTLSVVFDPESLGTRMESEGGTLAWYEGGTSGPLTDSTAFTPSYTLPEALAVGEYTYDASLSLPSTPIPVISFIQVTVEPAPLPEDKIQVEEGPFTFSNQQITPAVTVEGLTEGTDYTVVYQDNLYAGTASVLITGKGNYAGTITKTFAIEKAVLTFGGSLEAGAVEYGTPLSQAAVAAASGDSPRFDGQDVEGSWEIRSEDTPDVGEYTCTAVFVPSMPELAESFQPLTAPVEVTVNRKSFGGDYGSYVEVRAGQTLEAELAALPFLPEEMRSDGELTAVGLSVRWDPNGILDGPPAAADGKLTAAIKDSALAGQDARIDFTVQSKNMECSYSCQVMVVDRFTPYVDIPFDIEHTYDGKAPDLAAAIARITTEYNGKPVPGTVAVKDLGSVPVHVRESKSVTVVFTPEDTETYNTAESRMWIEIFPARITIRVRDQAVTQNGAMPEPAYTVEGLAPGERLKTEPVLTCEAQDTATAGTYAIRAAGAAVPDTGDYEVEIAYVDGTLTVRPSDPPVDPDPPGPDEPDPPGPDEPDPPGPDEPDPPGPDEPDPPGPDEPDPPGPDEPGEVDVKLEIKEGFTEVPPALLELEHLNTPEKLTQAMRTLLTQTGLPEGNTAVYDVALLVSTDGGKTWVPATAENFPSGGLTVTLPYPEGTGPAYRFTVVHLFTTADFGKIPGHAETFGPDEVRNLEAGIQVTLTGLSPVSVGWTKPQDPPKPPDKDDGGHSGGGGSVSPTYRVVVEKADGGSVSASRNWASGGSTVTLTVKAEPGYRLDMLTVTDAQGREVRLTDKGGGQYAFTMPGRGDVKVRAVFAPLEENEDADPCDGGAGCPSRRFADLERGAWYHEAVDFVLERGWMSGYGNGLFGPNNRLTRAQFAQILYHQAGRPAVTGNGSPFTDVAPDAWCAPAVAWAAEQGVVKGYDGGRFGPDDPITREQLAVMLWRRAGSPPASGELAFTDAERIGAHAQEAVRWAVQSGVMRGRAGGVLDPKGLATRAQAASMLKNFIDG